MCKLAPALTVIMPCFNMADTLPRALDSILMQRTDFSYEILIVDDCSTDKTVEVVRSYADKYTQVCLIQHEVNQGNAGAFYSGLCASDGEFFCVLDGDDYYTHREKLQRQVDFFRSDILQEYVAVAHHYIFDLCDGNLKIDKRSSITEFTYVDFLLQDSGYYHTSTYMFRNIFKGNVPEYLRDDRFRGDTVRTALHLQASHKKVKILDFAGSAYVYNYNGIWSGMAKCRQNERQLLIFESLRSKCDTKYEQKRYDTIINRIKKSFDESDDQYISYLAAEIDYYLGQIKNYTSMLAFEQEDFMLKSLYYSQYVDSLCATLGYINGIYHPECLQKTANNNRIAIVVDNITPQDSGVFREICELIEIYSDKEIMILLTGISDKEISKQVLKTLGTHPNVSIKAATSKYMGKIVCLSCIMAAYAPYKAYYYASHHDPYAQALMQSGICKNICLFSYDHGFICGISNPNLDCIIARRPTDYSMLHKHLGAKVIYIPAWGMEPKDCDGLQYKPFNGHSNLVTACAAAKFYKLDGSATISYLDNVLELLAHTNGKHFHFGPIPQEKLEYINAYLNEHNLPQDAFVHIEWSENILRDMLINHVDIFIEPFPIISFKITLEALSCGIPVISQESKRRMSTLDLIYPGNLRWKTKRDFIDTLCGLTVSQLEGHSLRSLEYFKSTHAIGIVRPYLQQEKPFPLSSLIEIIDGQLTEIRPYESLFDWKGSLNLIASREWLLKSQIDAKGNAPGQRLETASKGLFRLFRKVKSSIKTVGLKQTARLVIVKIKVILGK